MTRQPINTHGSLNAPAVKTLMAHSTRQPIKDHGSPRAADKNHGSINAPADKKTMAHPVGAQAL